MGFGMKQKTKNYQARDDAPTLGDAYCFIAMEKNTKLILAWHRGQRTRPESFIFTEKIAHATKRSFSNQRRRVCALS